MSTSATGSRRSPPGGGSTRDPQVHERILRAARELLLESGYARLTIEAIAGRAGVGKTTIYRWWRSKAALVHEVITLDPADAEPDTGDTAHDLEQWIRRVIAHMGRPEMVAAFPGVLADVARDESAAESIAHTAGFGHAHLRAIVETGQRSGQIPRDTSANQLAAVVTWLVGGAVTLHAASLAPGRAIDVDQLAAHVADLVLHGLLRPEP